MQVHRFPWVIQQVFQRTSMPFAGVTARQPWRGWLEGNRLSHRVHTVFFVPGAHTDVAVQSSLVQLGSSVLSRCRKEEASLCTWSGIRCELDRDQGIPSISVSSNYFPVKEFPAIYNVCMFIYIYIHCMYIYIYVYINM